MEYSAVIVTYNQKRALKRAIESVLKQTILPSEFIIIDNNSTDGTSEFLLKYKKEYPIFKIYRSKINLGTCKGINIGVKLAKKSVILNMDHDSELMNDNWVELAFHKLKQNRIALVWGTSNKKNFPRFKYENFIGSAILLKKKIFEQVGGFPDTFFIYDNEIDLTIRYYIAGFYPYFYEKLDVKHAYPVFDNLYRIKKRKLRIYYDLSNRLFIYWRYYPRYFAVCLSLLHILKAMKNYIKYSDPHFEPFRALKRFFSKFYINVLKDKKVLPLKQFLKICYQQQYPFPFYYLLKKIYG
ncbi:MAG: glycosyltransferase family 2 protein [Promethearchaeota archaeon]